MKKYCVLVIAMVFFSCSENFEVKDISGFNALIASDTSIEKPEDLIRKYYNYPEDEETPNLEIKSVRKGSGQYEITMIHENLPDDSQVALKIVMQAKKDGKLWKVKEVKQNWKCREGRGHTNWDTELCQ